MRQILGGPHVQHHRPKAITKPQRTRPNNCNTHLFVCLEDSAPTCQRNHQPLCSWPMCWGPDSRHHVHTMASQPPLHYTLLMLHALPTCLSTHCLCCWGLQVAHSFEEAQAVHRLYTAPIFKLDEAEHEELVTLAKQVGHTSHAGCSEGCI